MDERRLQLSRGAVSPAIERQSEPQVNSCKYFVSAVVIMWASSLKSAYMVKVSFVFAEPGPVSRVP